MTEEDPKSQTGRNAPKGNRDERDEESSKVARRGFAAAYRDFTEAVDPVELDLDPDVLLADVRDKSPGRSPGKAFDPDGS